MIANVKSFPRVFLKKCWPVTWLDSVVLRRVRRNLPPSEHTKYVVSSSDTGISNRIKCLLSAMRISEMCGRGLLVYWPRNDACNCGFNDLFANSIRQVEERVFRRIERHAWCNADFAPVYTWRLLVLPNEVEDGRAVAFPSADGCAIDLEYERVPASVKREYVNLSRTLTPCAYVRNNVEQYARAFDDSTVSVNVRSWPDSPSRRDRLFKIGNVFNAMDRCGDCTFFLSCDSDDVKKSIVDRYGKRVLVYLARTHAGDRSTAVGCQDALIDLLLLAKNHKLLASYGSTFSEMAWWFGGCEAKVEIMDSSVDIAAYLKTYKLVERAPMPLGLREEWQKTYRARLVC